MTCFRSLLHALLDIVVICDHEDYGEGGCHMYQVLWKPLMETNTFTTVDERDHCYRRKVLSAVDESVEHWRQNPKPKALAAFLVLTADLRQQSGFEQLHEHCILGNA